MKPFVSVTMSAFDVEPYLRQCLDCVVAQTLENIEVICVNDGSSDGTMGILEEYAACDSRFRIVNQEQNQGLAVARNLALELARGKYVAFVDSDDLFDHDLFRKAYELAEKNESDLVFWDYVVFHQVEELPAKIGEPSALGDFSPGDKLVLLERPAFSATKMIRTDTARSLGVCFPKGLTRQDIPVHWQLVTSLEKIALLPERLYYYRQQPSATTHKTDWRLADLVTVMDLVKDYLDGSGLYETYRDIFLQKQLELMSGFEDKIDPLLKPKAMELIRTRLGNEQWDYILNGKPLRWQARDFYMTIHGSTIARARRTAWLLARSCYRSIKRCSSAS